MPDAARTDPTLLLRLRSEATRSSKEISPLEGWSGHAPARKTYPNLYKLDGARLAACCERNRFTHKPDNPLCEILEYCSYSFGQIFCSGITTLGSSPKIILHIVCYTAQDPFLAILKPGINILFSFEFHWIQGFTSEGD